MKKINKEDGWYIECTGLWASNPYFGPWETKEEVLNTLPNVMCSYPHEVIRIEDGKIVEVAA